MLTELYRYAVDRNLSARPGFKAKKPRAYLLLSATGGFLGVDPGPEDEVFCPDIGAKALGTDKCNILVEKGEIFLTEGKPRKRAFYLNALRSGQAAEPRFGAILAALEDPIRCADMAAALAERKVKLSTPVGFKVDGFPIEASDAYLDWWNAFRSSLGGEGKSGKRRMRCIVTGQLTEPVSTVPKLSGLISVGGHPSGDALLCFDKDSFCSYGLEQGENAVVSEEAISAVNAALKDLLSRAPRPLAGAIYVHWFKQKVPDEFDLFSVLGDEQADAAQALEKARNLVESIYRGESPADILQYEYYMLALSGAGGRVMIRSWRQGTYEQLYRSVTAWFDGLRLVGTGGVSRCKPPKLTALNSRLLSYQKNGGKLFDRIRDELSGLEPQIIAAMLQNAPLPDAVAARALNYIRSAMMDGGDDEHVREPIPDALACQWLKLWRLRKTEKGDCAMREELNPEYPEAAYHCGRMMAVYAAIQREAMGKNLGAGVLQRYYASACTTPALVLGRLSQLATYHLSKIENQWLVDYFSDQLSEISCRIGRTAPPTLNLTQQAEFSLGYYQQRAALNSRFHKATDVKNEEEDEDGNL